MEIFFLGTGTSQGVPMIAHDSRGLDLTDPRNWRTRTSAHVVLGETHVQIDAAPELRLQCLANDIRQVDVFLLTHGHADHILGMDDLRRFCDLRGGEALPVYSSPEGIARVQEIFPYAITDKPLVRGYPAFQLHKFPDPLELPGGQVRAVTMPHGPINTLGLVFEETVTGQKLAYFTDCKEVSRTQRDLARGADLLVLDALRPNEHGSHLTIDEAIEVAQDIGATHTWFTHMTSHIDHATWDAKMPPGIRFAYDGLHLDCAAPDLPIPKPSGPANVINMLGPE